MFKKRNPFLCILYVLFYFYILFGFYAYFRDVFSSTSWVNGITCVCNMTAPADVICMIDHLLALLTYCHLLFRLQFWKVTDQNLHLYIFLFLPCKTPSSQLSTLKSGSLFNSWNIFLHRLPIQTSEHPTHFLNPVHRWYKYLSYETDLY